MALRHAVQITRVTALAHVCCEGKEIFKQCEHGADMSPLATCIAGVLHAGVHRQGKKAGYVKDVNIMAAAG